MMKKQSLLSDAKANKKDEFYTQMRDIEKELRYYKKHFKGKVVFCNCDDPFESDFFRYFVLNFNRLGLKKLIATCYSGSPIAGQQLSLYDVVGGSEDNKKKPYKAVVTKVYDATGDGAIMMDDIAELFKNGENELSELEGDGDFRSDECKALLEESDIVVTNPPFSLFREYVEQLIKYKKKFIIIGNLNAVPFKEFFPLLKNNKIWIGASIHSGDRAFYVPDDYPLDAAGCGIDEEGRKYIRVKGVRWYTNIDIQQRHEELILFRKYSEKEYPKYDNYNAINVKNTADIPCDYEGVMGVPISFMDKYNPEQFEIVGISSKEHSSDIERFHENSYYNGYTRGKVVTRIESNMPIMNTPDAGGTLCRREGSPDLWQLYWRIFIRNKKPEKVKEKRK